MPNPLLSVIPQAYTSSSSVLFLNSSDHITNQSSRPSPPMCRHVHTYHQLCRHDKCVVIPDPAHAEDNCIRDCPSSPDEHTVRGPLQSETTFCTRCLTWLVSELVRREPQMTFDASMKAEINKRCPDEPRAAGNLAFSRRNR